MFTGFVLALIGPLGVTIASQPPNTQQLSPLDSLVLLNGSNAEDAIEISASNDLHIQCDGEKYGSNPNVIDCQDARSYYKRSSQLFTYAERHSGQPASAFPLPVRQMGDGGKCYFEPVLIDKSRIGKSSINQLSDAAYALILQCAVRQSKGGIATGIGGENMGLVLGTYQPDIQCRGPFRTWTSCRGILGDMPVSTIPEIFGPEHDPAVQFVLPHNFESGDGGCVLRMFGTGSADVASWYNIWEAVAAVYAVCLRHRKVGTARNVGVLGHIFFTVTPLTPRLENLTSIADAK